MTLNFMWVHSRTGQSEVGSSFDYSGEEHLQPPLWAVHCEYFVFVLEYNSCLSSIYIIHPQNKFRASASTQLQPRRSLVSWDAPLKNLLEVVGVDSVLVSISINNSILADGEVKKVKEQLPAQHPARKLSIAADERSSRLLNLMIYWSW